MISQLDYTVSKRLKTFFELLDSTHFETDTFT